MGKLKSVAVAILLMAATSVNAAWRVVIDPWTTAQVTANTASQQLIEGQHNERLDSMSAKQQKIMQYAATMETIKELYQLTMQNITGFGEETKYYGEICELTLDIITSVPTVLEYISNKPVKNYILCVNEMSDVILETEGLVTDFVDIVNNGKVQNPIKKKTTITKCPKCGGDLKQLIQVTQTSHMSMSVRNADGTLTTMCPQKRMWVTATTS